MRKKFYTLLLLGFLLFAFTLTANAQIEFIIQYDDGNSVYYSGRPLPDDTCGVWFEPPTECQIISGLFNFNGNMGGDAEVFIWDIVDGFDPDNYFDSDEPGASPGPTPLGEILAGGITYSFDNSGEFQELVFEDYGYPPEDLDVGTENFYLGYRILGTGAQPYYPSILGDAADDRPYHSLTYLTDPGGSYPGESGWWAYGIDWFIRAKVNLYGDPPPTVEDLADPSDTYLEGPYTITATVTDQSTGGNPGVVQEVRLIYSVDGGAETTVVMTNTGGDEYAGDIEAVAVGSMINFRVEADDDQGHTSTAPSVAGYNFTYRQPSGAKILLVNDSGDTEGEEVYTEMLADNNFFYDYWYIDTGSPDDMGYPGADVLNTSIYRTVLWYNGPGYSGSLPDNDAVLADDPVANFMDDGGNFFFSSSDYLGGAFNPDVWTEFTAIPGTFMYEYLKVDYGWSDAHLDPTSGYSNDTLHFGIAADPIGGDFTAGVYSHPDPNYNDFCWPQGGGVTCFETEIDNESAGIWYDGDFKMVFLPWVLEACDDPDEAKAILMNVMEFFNENPGPSISMIAGSRYGIYGNRPYGVVAEVTDPDGIGSVSVKYRWDEGDWETGAMSLMIGDQYEYHWSPPGSWSTLEYYVLAMDAGDNINVGPTYECTYTGENYTEGATVLFCSDQYWAGSNYDPMITGPLDDLGVTYDVWDADLYGPPDFWTILSNYESCLWVGYSDYGAYDGFETFPVYSADNPFAMFLADGKNLLWSSEEYLGGLLGWEDTVFEAGTIFYDWLHIGEVLHDRSIITPGVGYSELETTADDMCAGMTSPLTLSGFEGDPWSDYLFPADNVATEGLFFESTGTFADNPAGFRDDEEQHNVVTLGYSLYMMDDTNRETFIGNVLDYWAANPGYSVGVEEPVQPEMPLSYTLEQNYPNPFNPITEIRFALPENANVELTVYNLMGQEVAKLLDRDLQAGNHQVTWNASQLSSGVYFYKLKTANFESVRKMILMK